MTIAGIEALNSAYESAVDAQSWDEALRILTKIAIRLATTPNLQRNLGGGGSQSITWTSQSIAEQQAFCRQMKASAASDSGPFQITKVKYVRPDATDAYE